MRGVYEHRTPRLGCSAVEEEAHGRRPGGPGLLALASSALRALPGELVRRLDAWALRQHAPVDIIGDAWCETCRRPWPCAEYVRLTESSH